MKNNIVIFTLALFVLFPLYSREARKTRPSLRLHEKNLQLKKPAQGNVECALRLKRPKVFINDCFFSEEKFTVPPRSNLEKTFSELGLNTEKDKEFMTRFCEKLMTVGASLAILPPSLNKSIDKYEYKRDRYLFAIWGFPLYYEYMKVYKIIDQ